MTPDRKTHPIPAVFNANAVRNGPGVYDLEDIRQRCRIDALTTCWHWSMAISDGSTQGSSRTPRISMPPGVISPGLRTMSVARVVWLMQGKRLPLGHIVWRTCGHDDCCAPHHLAAGTKAQEGAWMRASGHRRGNPHRLAAIERATAAHQAVPPETVHAVQQALAAGMLQREAAAEFGINKSTVSRIAAGRHIHQRLGVRGASVFTWRPAA